MRLLFMGFNTHSLVLSYLLSMEHEIVIYSDIGDYPAIRESGNIVVEYKDSKEKAIIEGLITNIVGAVTEEFDAVILSGTPSKILDYISKLVELEVNYDNFAIACDGIGIEETLLRSIDRKRISVGRILFDADAIYQKDRNTLKIYKITPISIGYHTKHKEKYLKEIYDTLRRSTQALWYDDIRELVWERAIVFSAIGSLSILLNIEGEDLKESKYAQELLQKILKEGEILARRKGFTLTNLYRVAIKHMGESRKIREKILSIKDKKVESNIESFIGAILQDASKHGLNLKYHEIIYKLLKAYEELHINL